MLGRYDLPKSDSFLGNCFLRGVLDGAVEGIGKGEKGGCMSILSRLGELAQVFSRLPGAWKCEFSGLLN